MEKKSRLALRLLRRYDSTCDTQMADPSIVQGPQLFMWILSVKWLVGGNNNVASWCHQYSTRKLTRLTADMMHRTKLEFHGAAIRF